MKTTVDGVSIELTLAQITRIEKVKAQRLIELKSFEDVLLKFGFTRYKDTRTSADVCYSNDDKGWWAEIYDNNRVWVTGIGLKSGSFPGGWVYWSPEEVIEELVKHI